MRISAIKYFSLSKLQDSPTHGKNGSSKVGVLRVVEGRADQEEYNLEAHTCVIGAGPASLVRLQGWFKPKAAMAITRKGDSYSATQLGGKALVNGQRLNGRHDLKDGDVLRVSGLTLEFRMKEIQ